MKEKIDKTEWNKTIEKMKELPKEFAPVLVIWRGTICGEGNVADFEGWLKDELGTDGRYLAEYITNPTEGKKGTGGRNDVLFAVAGKDIPKFAMIRLQFAGEMSWLEDAVVNESKILPEWVIAMNYIDASCQLKEFGLEGGRKN